MLIFNIIFPCALICMVYSQEVYLVPANRLLYVVEGSPLRIECINNEGTDSRPIWTRAPGSTAVIMSETEHLEGRKIEKSTLIFKKFYQHDVGTYYCSLTPFSPKQSVMLKLIREFKVEDHFYFGNKTTTLSCNIEVEEGARVEFKEWSFKHKPGDTRFKLEEGNSTITIVKPTREDAGVYNAIFAINAAGFEEYNHSCAVEYTAGPLVLNMKRSQNLNLHEDLHLICEILGYPPPVAKWIRNDVDNITEDERTEIKPHKGYQGAELIIKSIKYEEAGNYTCIAYSAEFMNSSSKSILVRVKDPLAWVWPLIGIVAEIVLLALIILICSKIQNRRAKASENEPLVRAGSRKQGEKYE